MEQHDPNRWGHVVLGPSVGDRVNPPAPHLAAPDRDVPAAAHVEVGEADAVLGAPRQRRGPALRRS
jgi:hypothetical protein